MAPSTSARLVPDRHDLIDAAAVLALVAAAMLGLRSCYGGLAWLACGVLGIVVGLVAAYVVHAYRAAVGWLALAVPVLGAVFSGPVLPDTAMGGVVPTLATLEALVRGGLQGWANVLTVVPPVGSAYHLLALPYAAGLLASATGYWLARRLRRTWPALVPVVALAAGSILVGTREPAFPILQGVVLPAGALAWAGLRRSRGAATGIRPLRTDRTGKGRRLPVRSASIGLALLTAASVAGAGLGPHLPGVDDHERVVLRESTTPPFDPHQFASPLGRFRRYVTEQEKTRLFTVEGAPAGARIRLATMDTYDGLVWSVAGGVGPSAGSSGWFEKVGDTIPVPLGTTGPSSHVQVRVEGLSGIWMPSLGSITKASFTGPRTAELADSFRYNRATGTAAVPVGLREGDTYDLDAVVPPTPAWDELARRQAERLDTSAVAVPDEVKQLAGNAAENADDDTGRVLALQKTLRQGYYSDGKAGQTPSLPGHSAWRLSALVAEPEAMVGNDEQYAAAMALALTDLRIRSRIVMGFIVPQGATSTPVPVLGSNASAWVEVAVEGFGWVPIDPVPDENRRLDRNRPRPEPKKSPRSQPLPPPPVVAPAQEVQAGGQQRRGGADADKDGPSWLHDLAPVLAAASPLLVVLLAVGLILLLKRRRRLHRFRDGPPSRRVAGGWYEVLDLATDLGRPVAPVLTRREAAGQLGGGVAVLASRADACVFGQAEPSEEEVREFWRQVDEHRSQALGDVRWWVRWRARLNPASLWRGSRLPRLRGLLPISRPKRSQ